MKFNLKSLKTAMFGIGLTVLAAQTSAAENVEKSVNISNAFIASGFDPASPMAILSGVYPNSCYSWKKANIEVTGEFARNVHAVANVRQGLCLMVLVPFTEEVLLTTAQDDGGRLATGTHTIRFMNGDGTYQEKTLKIE